MIYRTEKGGLAIKHLDIQIFFDGLYEVCKTEKEVDWVKDQLESYVDRGAEECVDNL